MPTDNPVVIDYDFIVTDVAVDGDTLYFTDPTNNRLYEMNKAGEIIQIWELAYPAHSIDIAGRSLPLHSALATMLRTRASSHITLG